MPATETDTIVRPGLPETEIKHVGPQPNGGARVDVDVEGGPQWRLDVTKSGNYEIVTSWNSAGNLADVPVPDWVAAELRDMAMAVA